MNYGEKMKGILLSMKHEKDKCNPRKAIIRIGDNTLKKFHQLVGRKVVWIHPKTGKKFIGKIVRLHGKKGCVIAYFRKQIPGEALGSKVQII